MLFKSLFLNNVNPLVGLEPATNKEKRNSLQADF